MPCTLREEIASKNNIEKLDSNTLWPGYKGIIIKIYIVKKKVITGERKKIKIFELEGIIISLINNFNPSAKGCKKPSIPVILGPFLLWTLLITFLSISVNNAIHNNIKITLLIKNNNFSIKKYNI